MNETNFNINFNKWNLRVDGSPFRVTTATHPTTSTQTRSTARPQAHATTGIPVSQIRNLRPAMQLSSFDRYLPCNSHHIHEPENAQPAAPQQNQPQPRANRINITRAPQVHRIPNSVRFANFLSNHLQSQVNHLRGSGPNTPPSPTTRSSSPIGGGGGVQSSQSPSTQSNTSGSATTATVGTLNDAQLSTPIPIFGNQIELQVRDFVNVSPTPSTLNRIRSDLRQFVMLKLSLTSNPSEEDVALVKITLFCI